MKNNMIIPDFNAFVKRVEKLYKKCNENKEGKVNYSTYPIFLFVSMSCPRVMFSLENGKRDNYIIIMLLTIKVL